MGAYWAPIFLWSQNMRADVELFSYIGASLESSRVLSLTLVGGLECLFLVFGV